MLICDFFCFGEWGCLCSGTPKPTTSLCPPVDGGCLCKPDGVYGGEDRRLRSHAKSWDLHVLQLIQWFAPCTSPWPLLESPSRGERQPFWIFCICFITVNNSYVWDYNLPSFQRWGHQSCGGQISEELKAGLWNRGKMLQLAATALELSLWGPLEREWWGQLLRGKSTVCSSCVLVRKRMWMLVMK